MKYISLATRYRPQRFDEIAGQELIKTALSRASAENRVAPGYLLAGTRGVGKTTIARIFAKALNCEHAPCAEPCNECSACRRITQGSYPDVIEMDGASNNKVEDARELREKVGFAPMEGRYKIFIIDEAHMLTNQAFNALLKTLEEPPAYVVFIFATTELHKFPTTILSRCQVFSFSHLQEETLIEHLSKVLNSEHIEYEENAVRLIAHRGAGSARDSMSLLDQVLSFGPPSLTADFVRSVLGLVSQDILENLLLALAGGNCGEVAILTRELVSKQIDIRYFVSELTDTIRSLFLLHTCNRETVARLGLSDNELAVLERIAPKFSPGYLHAAWQMLLDSGRSLMPSSGQEPAAALEFLLVNMALLPRLLPAEVAGINTGAAINNAGQTVPGDVKRDAAPKAAPSVPQHSQGQLAGGAQPVASGQASVTGRTCTGTASHPANQAQSAAAQHRPDDTKAAAASPVAVQPQPGRTSAHSEEDMARQPEQQQAQQSAQQQAEQQVLQPAKQGPVIATAEAEHPALPDIEKVQAWLAQQCQNPALGHRLKGFSCKSISDGTCLLEGGSVHQTDSLKSSLPRLEGSLSAFLQQTVRITLQASQEAIQNAGCVHAQPELNRPELQHCIEVLNARVEQVRRR